MARTSSSRKVTLPVRYRQSPPRPKSPIAVVTRGYRLQLKPGVPVHFADAPSPNPPSLENVPVPPMGRRRLQRTYSFLIPTSYGAADETMSLTVGPQQHTPPSAPVPEVGTPSANVGAADGNVSPDPHTPISTIAAQYGSSTGKKLNSFK